ncbi:hypothetical protein FQN49_004791 [Arthroderma sp. PD_2]|nr:hypothetical protein FQN49_004791 [Arthroderma sp. PD_2]
MLSPCPDGPCTWEVVDWDARRWLQVAGLRKTFPEDDQVEEFVARYADQLGPGEHKLIADEHRELMSVSSEDPTWEIRYPPYPGPLDESDKHEVIRRSELTEVDRLGVGADLVEYSSSDGATKGERVVFKYSLIQQRVEWIWMEIHILKALRGNDRFVPFHRMVIDDVTKNILGFTSQYIPGGTLEDYRGPFYFRWLKQLTDAVDDLNLRYGIMHQDFAPRNILIDPTTQDLKIFDFDRSAQIGGQGSMEGCNDVDALIFTIYEALTLDESFREEPPWEQDVSQVENMGEWKLQLPLEDGIDISKYRASLAEWATVRRTAKTIKRFSEATEPILWPEYQQPPKIMIYDENVTRLKFRRKRTEVEGAGGYVTRWERPPQQKLKAPN